MTIFLLGLTHTALAGSEFTWSDGVVTWVYRGSEDDILSGTPSDGWVWIDDTRSTEPAAVEDSIRVDADGDVYAVLSVDEEALAEKVALSRDEVFFRWGEEPTGREEARTSGSDPYVGWAYDRRLSWSAASCGGGDDEWVWNSESRNWVGDPMDNREEKAVLILLNGDPWCSGVMVDSDSVLTAAHCLWNGAGNAISVGSLGVCSRENRQTYADCSTVDAKIIASGYTISSDPIGLDFALLDLSETDIADGEYMAMSSSSDATIAASEQDSTGYPAFVPSSCGGGSGTSNIITANAQTVDDNYDAAKAFRQTGNITYTGSDWFGTTLDAVAMQSGSPIYFFPAPPSTAHYVTAVLSRQREIIGPAYVAGPKVSAFKSFVEANK